MRLTNIQKRVIMSWVILLVFLAAGSYLFVFKSQINQLESHEETLSLEEQKEGVFMNRIKEQGTEVVDVSSIRSSIPESMLEDEIIHLLNQAAEASLTTVYSYHYADQSMITLQEDEEVKQLTMEISGDTPSIEHLNQFVRKLESSNRFINILMFDFQVRNGKITFQIQFQAYSRKFEDI
ncbi:hypothetical protein [Tenuibacillus multivorans]|uniref:Uncharacterized protein n=1 Tax=Tenuibacillus multivorans TaxID=237069 RepID=A0A1H0FZ24_9BACI|nr:hypothetical protein [Tenuibacillus multivorans]GEL78149.1 hypothetical protein TMU01_23840 [Tenuibacillus multivorans]SDN99907.1 hypothetical protein SAMN05216498_0407 [Tenuibacillus multivorans]